MAAGMDEVGSSGGFDFLREFFCVKEPEENYPLLKSLRIHLRLILGLLGTVALLLGLALYLTFSLSRIFHDQARIDQIRNLVEEVRSLDRSLQQPRPDFDGIDAIFRRIEADSPVDSSFAKRVGEEKKRIFQWRNSPAAHSGGISSPGSGLLPEIQHDLELDLRKIQDQVRLESRNSIFFIWVAVGAVILVAFLIQQAVANSILDPLSKLGAAVKSLQTGDYSVRSTIRTGDEIQMLGDAFNAMAENILQNRRELEEKNRTLSEQQESLRDSNVRLEKWVGEKTEELKKTLESAQSDRAKLQAIINSMPDGLILVNAAGAVVGANQAALQILGHPHANSIEDWIRNKPGAFAFRLLNQQIVDFNDFPFSRAARGEFFSNYSLYIRRPDNQSRLVSFSGGPVSTDPDGTVQLALNIFRDVTDELALRKELEEKNLKLGEAARLKDEFLATLSHELRTPLTPIISYAHLVRNYAGLDEENRKSLEVIERNARALSRMIDELLSLSGIMNRKIRLQKENTELNEWIRSTLQTLQPAWKARHQTVEFQGTKDPVLLKIDSARLTQVLTNLVTNAIKFTPERGQIRVTFEKLADRIQIAVNDSGVGLTRYEISQIFEIFHQGRSSLHRSASGLGIGLSVAKSLAELHGGSITAESEGPGCGSTFTLWLPYNMNEVEFNGYEPGVPRPGKVDTTLLRGRRILLVEDSADTLEALRKILERRECQVLTASDGEQGLNLALREHPEIIISDLWLPGMDGLSLIREVRRNDKNVIAISLSGLGRDQDISAALEAGFNAHLMKPVEITVLDQTLIRELESKHSLPTDIPVV